MKESINTTITERKLIARIFYGYAVFVLLVEWCLHHSIHQLHEPILIEPGADNFYWLLHLLNIPQLIAGNFWIAIVFEAVLLTLAFSCFLFPAQSKLSVLFTFVLLIYMVTRNSYAAHHEHGFDGLLIMSFIFWSNNERRFSLLFRALRFYVIFIFVSAAWWKIFRGSAFNPNQMSETLKIQHLDFLSNNPGGNWYRMIAYLIDHQQVSHAILLAAIAIQLFFAVGFFTKRLDWLLLLLFFLFFAGDQLLMCLSFYALYPLALVFWKWKTIRAPFSVNNFQTE